jgi:beta-glucosidase-like glycosyl hydrolase/CubicO group peptidase (beta-lactamase class C family)
MKLPHFFLKFFIFSPLLLMLTVFSGKKEEYPELQKDPPFIGYQSRWVDSLMRNMTLNEKIGQLFMVEVYPNDTNQSRVKNLIKKYNIGGIIYFKGHPTRVAQLSNYFQSISKIPLMIAIDGEWGVGMRLDSVVVFPHQMMLGALSDNRLIYDMAVQISKQCRLLGINIDFAPVVDINNNPMNPVIGVRSFGENKISVAQKGYAYELGLQDNDILAVAKHFPGHGDTDKDSHKSLPVVNASIERLDTLELFPFEHLIHGGVGGVMVAHLYVPALDNSQHLPSTLSEKIVNELLRNKLKFKGLIFTDALGMQGIAKYYGPGIAEVKALKAGNDILLMSENVPKAFASIKKAVISGQISEKSLNEKVKRILYAKYWLNLKKYKPVDTKNLYKKLNSSEAKLVNRKIVENALTLVKNNDNLIPFKNLKDVKYACVSIGNGQKTVFQQFLLRYTKVDNFAISKSASQAEYNQLFAKLKNYDYVILGFHKTNQYNVRTYGISSQSIDFAANLANRQKVILDLFGNPYALKLFKNLKKMPAILVSYEDSKISQELSAQLLFGGIEAKGHLPVSISNFPAGTGFSTAKIRLKYTVPEELKINSHRLKLIDSIVYRAIAEKAFPGCEVMAIKDGNVFFQKSYGYHTYKMKNHVKWNDVYDLASVTKIISTIPSLMKLYDEKKFSINGYMSDYLPELDSTNKKNLRIIDVLTHQARLEPWIPFFYMAMNKDGSWKKEYLSTKQSEKYCVKITDRLYTTKQFDSIIYQKIYESPLLRRKRYRYSDLGFYMFKKIIEQKTKMPLSEYVEKNFYEPLGAYTLGYNPLSRGIPKSSIPPTEYDYRFRKQLIDGYVHDYGAAMLGGVGGHAGLFSDANDLAKMLQMYLQYGQYAGHRYLSPKVIGLFTTKPFSYSRRALGFDSTDGHGEGPACALASYSSYGHTGFTGTMVWVDPQYHFIYIFLSNRVYPSIENHRINELRVREKIQSIFYQSFLYYTK